MGCCLSATNPSNKDPNNQNGLTSQQFLVRSPTKSKGKHEVDHRFPPPVEEETVKEVLSETPISKPKIPMLVEEGEKFQMPVAVIQPKAENFETKGLINKAEETPEISVAVIEPKAQNFEIKGVVDKAEEASEMSQISEICSVSGSFSTATTATITEKREDEVTSKRSSREGTPTVNRSPSNPTRKRPYTADGGGARERRAKSPGRRAEPLPEKKSQVGPRASVRGRESGQVTTKRFNAGATGVRRDPGEGSGRRSRSPSTRTVSGVSKLNAGRSPLKATRGGGRQWPAKGADDTENQKNESDKVREENDGVQQGAHESLENPHVSMECFIFL